MEGLRDQLCQREIFRLWRLANPDKPYRGKKLHTTAHIRVYDVFGFFQSSFSAVVKSMVDSGRSTKEEADFIAAMKERRTSSPARISKRSTRRTKLPGGADIAARFAKFLRGLPDLCAWTKLRVEELTFVDFTWLAATWLHEQVSPLRQPTTVATSGDSARRSFKRGLSGVRAGGRVILIIPKLTSGSRPRARPVRPLSPL